jgi:hypothetical protein
MISKACARPPLMNIELKAADIDHDCCNRLAVHERQGRRVAAVEMKKGEPINNKDERQRKAFKEEFYQFISSDKGFLVLHTPRLSFSNLY